MAKHRMSRLKRSRFAVGLEVNLFLHCVVSSDVDVVGIK
jgi:hypothetical protein